MTGRHSIIVVLLLLCLCPAAFGQDTPPNLDPKHLDGIVRDSGLLAEVFDQNPGAVIRCSPTGTPNVILVEYLNQNKVVGWAKVRGESVLAGGKGPAPVEEPPAPPTPAPVAPIPTTPAPAPVPPRPTTTATPEVPPTPPTPPSAAEQPVHDLVWWLNELLPRYRDTALMCLALVVTVLVSFDLRVLTKARNLDLLSLFVPAAGSLAAFLTFGPDHNFVRLTAWSIIILATIWFLIRSLLIGYSRTPRPEFTPNLPLEALVVLLVLACLVHSERLLRQDLDDSGIWSVRGAQHIISRGELPYGKLGPGDAYGPVIYLAEIPAVVAFPPTYVDSRSGLVMPWNPATPDQKVRIATLTKQLQDAEAGKKIEGDPAALREMLVQLETGVNELPPARRLNLSAARVTAAVCDGLILLGIIFIGMRYADLRVGLAAAIIYALLPCTVNRLVYLDSLVPVALVVWAVALMSYPLIAGALLALGAGATLFPAFLFPLWLSYYAHKGGILRFTLAFGLVGVMLLAGLWLYTDNWSATQLRMYLSTQVEQKLLKAEQDLKNAPTGSQQARALEDARVELNGEVQSLRRPTLPIFFVLGRMIAPQENPSARESYLYSFWGQLDAAGARFSFLRPLLMLLSLMFYVALFFLPGRRDPVPLIALSAAVLISTELWRPVAGGLVAWYAPLLVLSFLLYERTAKETEVEKFVPLQDVKPAEPPRSAVEEIDAFIGRHGRQPRPGR